VADDKAEAEDMEKCTIYVKCENEKSWINNSMILMPQRHYG